MGSRSSFVSRGLLLLPPLVGILMGVLFQGSLACFDQVEYFSESASWMQAIGVKQYLEYRVSTSSPDERSESSAPMDQLMILNRGRNILEKEVILKCLSVSSPNHVLTEVVYDSSTMEPRNDSRTSKYRCYRFEPLADGILRITEPVSYGSLEGVNCETETYAWQSSVLINHDKHRPTQPCPLQGSFQATVQNSRGVPCIADMHFNCNSKHAEASFKESCQPPEFKHYMNKNRHHIPVYLRCVGNWEVKSSGVNVLVMMTNDMPSSVWCLHYKPSETSSEVWSTLITFNGDFYPTLENPPKATQDSMSGHLAKYVPTLDSRCSPSQEKKCLNQNVDCSKSNECPGRCKRCYRVPGRQDCGFRQDAVGRWSTMDYSKELTVDVKPGSFETSSGGEYVCYKSSQTTAIQNYRYNVVQHSGLDVSCIPLYACMQIFSVAPGVSTYSLRRSVVNDESGMPNTCDRTDEIFQENPLQEGHMMTLLNTDKLQIAACEFGKAFQFPASKDDPSCRLHVEDCSGNDCKTLNVSYVHETCSQSALPVMKIAGEHNCYASLKFKYGRRGFITYSEELDKYLCWVYASSRLFIPPLYMCNDDGVDSIFDDKHSMDKYAPLNTLIVPPLSSIGTPLVSMIPSSFVMLSIVCGLLTTSTIATKS